MTEAERYADRLSQDLNALKQGSLRFWGHWHGRPFDNIHRIVGCEAEGDVLRVHFDGEELLSVWSPSGLESTSDVLRIADAARVRWEWFFYGRPHVAANLYFVDVLKGVAGTSNVDWYQPEVSPAAEGHAVEIL